MDERLTRHSALHFNQGEPHYDDPCPGHGGSLRAPMEQGRNTGWNNQNDLVCRTAGSKTFPNSKPLFEGGAAHPEDYFDVVEHFSESTG